MSPDRMYHQTLGLGMEKVTDHENRVEENMERARVLVAEGEGETGRQQPWRWLPPPAHWLLGLGEDHRHL